MPVTATFTTNEDHIVVAKDIKIMRSIFMSHIKFNVPQIIVS